MISLLIVLINLLKTALEWLILFRVIMSWIQFDGFDSIKNFVFNVTEPIIFPFRNLVDRFLNLRGIDISPIIALIFIQFVLTQLIIFLSRLV